MAIFGSGTLSADYAAEAEVTYNVSPTEEGSSEILYEGARDLYRIVAAAYISDIMIESSVLEGTGDMEVLTEGTIKDLKDKIVKKFKEIWAKIKEWFNRIIESVKVFFMSGETFANKYESALIEKAKTLKAESVVYEGYEYAIDADAIEGEVTSRVEKYKAVINKAIGNVDKETDTNEVVTAACENIGGGNIAEIKEDFTKKVRGGDIKVTIKNVGGKVSDMIKVCKNAKKLIKAIKDLKDKTEKSVNAAIADINKDEGANTIAKKTTLYNSIISVQQGLNSVGISLIKEQYRTYTSVLKKVFSVKVAKESVEPEVDTNDGSSLLESALNLL